MVLFFLDFDETLVKFRTSNFSEYDPKTMSMFTEAKQVLVYLVKNHDVVIASRSKNPDLCWRILYENGFVKEDFLAVNIQRTETYHKKEHTVEFEELEVSKVFFDDNPQTILEVEKRGIIGCVVDPQVGLRWSDLLRSKEILNKKKHE